MYSMVRVESKALDIFSLFSCPNGVSSGCSRTVLFVPVLWLCISRLAEVGEGQRHAATASRPEAAPTALSLEQAAAGAHARPN